MAKLYTLDEAAAKLGLPVDVFKRKLKTEWVKDVQMIPGNPPHFRAADIDEFARVLGAASDPGLAPGPVGSAPAEDANDFSFAMADDAPPMPSQTPKRPRLPAADEPLLIAVDDDIFTAPPPPTPGKSGKSGSDSDVRLDPAPGRAARADADQSMPTEEITIDLSGPSSAVIKPSGGSGKLSAPKSGTKLAGPESSKIPGPTKNPTGTKGDDSSSEFELSLDPSNDSLELELTADSSEEVDLGGLLLPGDSKGGQSGINLSRPADSGLSLERKAPKTGPMNLASAPADSDSDIDFELSLDAPAGLSASKLSGPRSAVSRSTGPDSDSEFELTLDDNSGISDVVADARAGRGGAADNSQGDIFETDFELPSMEEEPSGVVAEGTDLAGEEGFEIDASDMVDPNDDESASQVMVIDDGEPILDEDDAPRGRGRRGSSADLDDELERGASASGALRGVRGGDDDDYRGAPVQAVVGAPAKWGALPAVVLFLTLPLMFIGTVMSYEMVRGMFGYHQPTPPGNLVVRGLAESVFDLKPGD